MKPERRFPGYNPPPLVQPQQRRPAMQERAAEIDAATLPPPIHLPPVRLKEAERKSAEWLRQRYWAGEKLDVLQRAELADSGLDLKRPDPAPATERSPFDVLAELEAALPWEMHVTKREALRRRIDELSRDIVASVP